MRRALLFVLVLLIAGSFAWASGQKEGAAAAQKRIVHYHWTETSYDKINNNAVALFQKKHPDVEVRMLLLPDGDRAAKIRTALAANGEIDSFALNNGESAEFLGAGQMVPIVPKAFGKNTIEDVVKMWTPGAIETSGGVWDGKYYGIPFELSNYVAWINTAHMKEAGLNPATRQAQDLGAVRRGGQEAGEGRGRRAGAQRLRRATPRRACSTTWSCWP